MSGRKFGSVFHGSTVRHLAAGGWLVDCPQAPRHLTVLFLQRRQFVGVEPAPGLAVDVRYESDHRSGLHYAYPAGSLS